jgi:hypothetical protein
LGAMRELWSARAFEAKGNVSGRGPFEPPDRTDKPSAQGLARPSWGFGVLQGMRLGRSVRIGLDAPGMPFNGFLVFRTSFGPPQ